MRPQTVAVYAHHLFPDGDVYRRNARIFNRQRNFGRDYVTRGNKKFAGILVYHVFRGDLIFDTA